MPHNFIRIDPYTAIPTDATALEKPKGERRTPGNVEPHCKKHGGVYELLLFDADTNPRSAFVQFKNGDVDAILTEFPGSQRIYRYFDSDEMKPDTP